MNPKWERFFNIAMVRLETIQMKLDQRWQDGEGQGRPERVLAENPGPQVGAGQLSGEAGGLGDLDSGGDGGLA